MIGVWSARRSRESVHRQRGRFRRALLVAVAGVSVAGCGAQSHPATPSSDPAVRVAALTSSIRRAGATLCELNRVVPAQGTLAVIDVFSFSATTSCDAASSTGQGVMYILQYPVPGDASFFLALARQNSRFAAGWQAGAIAVAVGDGVPASTERRVVKALRGEANMVFPSN
jgi:hypothetical protein